MNNITELREQLASNYNKMYNGQMNLSLGKELANTAGKIIASCAIELEYNKRMGHQERIAFLEKVVSIDEHQAPQIEAKKAMIKA